VLQNKQLSLSTMRPRTRSEIFELKEKPLELSKIVNKDDGRGISKPYFASTNTQRVKSLIYVDEEEEVVDSSQPTSSNTNDNNTNGNNKSKKHATPLMDSKGSLYHFATFPPDLFFLIPAFIAALLAGAAKPAQAMLIGKVFTTLARYSRGYYATPGAFLVAATRYCVAIIGLGAAGFFFDWIMLTCFDLFSAHSLLRARRKVFVRFMTRDFAWYDSNSGIMGTLTTLNRCFGDFQGATSISLALVSQACCTIVASFCFSFYYSWAMTLVSLCSVPLMVVVSSITSRYMSQTYYQFKAITEDAGTLVDWAITSLTTVKQFNGEQVVFDRFVNILKRGSRVYFRFSHYAGIQQGLARFLVLGMFVPMFALGTFLVHKGKIESGAVVTVFSCMFMISGAFSALGMRIESLQKGQVAVARLKHFLDLGMSENTYFKNMIGIFPPYCKGSITFQNV
jgi:ATP-binding cassette subfamily B (MDR/TAP) protein 1